MIDLILALLQWTWTFYRDDAVNRTRLELFFAHSRPGF